MRERRLVFSNYLGSDHELIYRTSRTLNLGGLGPNKIKGESIPDACQVGYRSYLGPTLKINNRVIQYVR
jgi:hypothetical protein